MVRNRVEATPGLKLFSDINALSKGAEKNRIETNQSLAEYDPAPSRVVRHQSEADALIRRMDWARDEEEI